jgi:hypothetical protein
MYMTRCKQGCQLNRFSNFLTKILRICRFRLNSMNSKLNKKNIIKFRWGLRNEAVLINFVKNNLTSNIIKFWWDWLWIVRILFLITSISIVRFHFSTLPTPIFAKKKQNISYVLKFVPLPLPYKPRRFARKLAQNLLLRVLFVQR